jgi:hypothetical protein
MLLRGNAAVTLFMVFSPLCAAGELQYAPHLHLFGGWRFTSEINKPDVLTLLLHKARTNLGVPDLANDEFGYSVLALFAVHVAMHKDHHISVLLNLSGVADVARARTLVWAIG